VEQPTYQTVRLSPGRHPSPKHGACVMELASMLAGEPFTDHPRSVSRPLASFLRGYNDMLSDERRQDLYRYAALAVGTSGCDEVEAARAAHLVAWADARARQRARWSPFARRRRAKARNAPDDWEASARYAINTIGSANDDTHAAVMSLLDELIAMGGAGHEERSAVQATDAPARAPRRSPAARVPSVPSR
jgi:hypothetical protein